MTDADTKSHNEHDGTAVHTEHRGWSWHPVGGGVRAVPVMLKEVAVAQLVGAKMKEGTTLPTRLVGVSVKQIQLYSDMK